MNYYYDTEFIEGTQKKLFEQTKPTIDLISIGIVAEDGREYYVISKDFNLKEAWNRYDLVVNKLFPIGPEYNKSYWIRDNVLKPMFYELHLKDLNISYKAKDILQEQIDKLFTYKNLKRLVKKYGKSNKQIAEEILDFVNTNGSFVHKAYDKEQKNKVFDDVVENYGKPQFYGYYSAYDHVALCWLFGKMIDLPKGFPMYTIDLKQILDEKSKHSLTKPITNDHNYPKQINEHNALADAKWNKQLHEFLNNL